MSTFDLFPLLAPEMRQRIWELSVEPRVIAIEIGDNFNYDLLIKPEQRREIFKNNIQIVKKGTRLFQSDSTVPSENLPDMDIYFASWSVYRQFVEDKSAATYAICKASPPVGLGVSRESRSCLLPMFNEVLSSHSKLVTGGSIFSIPTWINFAIDTIHCTQDDLPYMSKTPWMSQIQHVAVDVDDTDALHINMYGHERPHLTYIVSDMTNLKHVTIRDMEPRWDDWHSEWHDLLADYYNRCRPAPFDLRIINPNFPETGELNRRNFMSIWRHEKGIVEGSEENFDVMEHQYEWMHNGKDCPTKCGQVMEGWERYYGSS